MSTGLYSRPDRSGLGSRYAGGVRRGRPVGGALVNDMIQDQSVLLVDDRGGAVGLLSRDQALRKARDAGLDLVKVGEGPDGGAVCKIMDHGRYAYRLRRRTHDAKKNQKASSGKNKEIRISQGIEENDFGTKIRKVKEFLARKHRVKVTLIFRGRTRQGVAVDLVRRVVSSLEECSRLEVPPPAKLEGLRAVSVSFVPR